MGCVVRDGDYMGMSYECHATHTPCQFIFRLTYPCSSRHDVISTISRGMTHDTWHMAGMLAADVFVKAFVASAANQVKQRQLEAVARGKTVPTAWTRRHSGLETGHTHTPVWEVYALSFKAAQEVYQRYWTETIVPSEFGQQNGSLTYVWGGYRRYSYTMQRLAHSVAAALFTNSLDELFLLKTPSQIQTGYLLEICGTGQARGGGTWSFNK